MLCSTSANVIMNTAVREICFSFPPVLAKLKQVHNAGIKSDHHGLVKSCPAFPISGSIDVSGDLHQEQPQDKFRIQNPKS